MKNYTKESQVTSGKLHNGVAYKREVETYVRSDGGKYRHIITDFEKGDKAARVIEYSGYCSFGRQNAEMFQTRPTVGKTRTYKHVENAKAKAIELVLSK